MIHPRRIMWIIGWAALATITLTLDVGVMSRWPTRSETAIAGTVGPSETTMPGQRAVEQLLPGLDQEARSQSEAHADAFDGVLTPEQLVVTTDEFLARINTLRTSKGLGPFRVDRALTAFA